MKAIYKIENEVTKEFYIGGTNNLTKRIYQHFRLLEKNSHPNKNLQESFNKYGKDTFKTIVLKELPLDMSKKDILNEEQEFLSSMDKNLSFNVLTIADAGGAEVLGIKCLLLDLKSNVVGKFDSIQDIRFHLNRKSQINFREVNKKSKINKIYRIVTEEFYANNKYEVDSWSEINSSVKSNVDKINENIKSKEVVVTIDDIKYEFKNNKEVADFLQITSERVRQILHRGSTTYDIVHKYPELNKYSYASLKSIEKFNKVRSLRVEKKLMDERKIYRNKVVHIESGIIFDNLKTACSKYKKNYNCVYSVMNKRSSNNSIFEYLYKYEGKQI